MKALLIALTLAATPLHAGGPVIVTEEPPIADVRPQGDGGNWVVPVIVGAIVRRIIPAARHLRRQRQEAGQ